jgi:AraC family transcriptional regulator
MQLSPGTFLGIPLKMRCIAGFIVTEQQYDARTAIRRHSHELAYFSFVLAGSYVERYPPARENQCCNDTVLYHPAGEDHSDRFGDCGGRLLSLEIRPEWMVRLRDYELDASAPRVFSARQLLRLRSRIHQAFSDFSPRAELLVESAAIELLSHLPWTKASRAESRTPCWLTQAVEILHAEFCRPFSLTSIAHRVETHPVHLARTFRRHYHRTMGDYLRQLRISYAMDALKGDTPVSDIAAQAGFSDQSHLGRLFKTATGMTPRQFRLAQRNTD